MTNRKNEMPVWEMLQKKMIWQQLDFIKNKRILDYGSGFGHTANHFASDNEVVAIEPSDEMLSDRVTDGNYTQIQGGLDALREIESQSFDVIFCHYVFEYTDERQDILKEFSRVLKDDGLLSIVKHNRSGRVMQMVTLLNNFERANDLLDGKCGIAQKYGAINYYTNSDLEEWNDSFNITKTLGIRTFWALQQNQEIHQDPKWQDEMLLMESRVSDIDEYKAIASFHHILLHKNL